jgi:hypothetical protein
LHGTSFTAQIGRDLALPVPGFQVSDYLTNCTKAVDVDGVAKMLPARVFAALNPDIDYDEGSPSAPYSRTHLVSNVSRSRTGPLTNSLRCEVPPYRAAATDEEGEMIVELAPLSTGRRWRWTAERKAWIDP